MNGTQQRAGLYAGNQVSAALLIQQQLASNLFADTVHIYI